MIIHWWIDEFNQNVIHLHSHLIGRFQRQNKAKIKWIYLYCTVFSLCNTHKNTLIWALTHTTHTRTHTHSHSYTLALTHTRTHTHTHTLAHSNIHSLLHTYLHRHTHTLAHRTFFPILKEKLWSECVILCSMNYANDTKCQIILRLSCNLKSDEI